MFSRGDENRQGTYPRVIDRGDIPPAFIIEEEQINNIILPTFAPGVTIPFSQFMDENWHCHFEWCNSAFDPSKEKKRHLKWFLNPRSYYLRIAPSIIDGSLLRYERNLIGAANYHYFTDKQEVFCQYLGFLSEKQAIERGIDPRVCKGAFPHFHEEIDRLNWYLGVRRLTTTSSVPALQRHIEAFGWKRHELGSWKDYWKLFRSTFPVSLWKREIPYQKIYRYP